MNKPEYKIPEFEGRLEKPQTYRISYKEHGKLETYSETMYWENDLLHELSLYSDPIYHDRFELVSVFLVVDGGIDEKVYDGKDGWVDGLDRTEPVLPGPDQDDEREFQEGWDLAKKESEWKSTWDDYDPWDAYPQVSGENGIWEPEHLGDR